MKSLEIKGSPRESVGKSNTRELRKNDMVPCVLYGGKENVNFYSHENTFRKLIYTPNVYLVKLTIDDKTYNAIIQELQFHPVTDKLLHIDFLEIFDDKKVDIRIPVQLEGLPQGVQEGGKLMLENRIIKVRGFTKDLPEFLKIDITNVGLGKTVQVGELSFDNLELLDPKNTVVASVKLTRIAKAEEAEELEEEEITEEEEAEEGKEDVKETKDTKTTEDKPESKYKPEEK